MYVPISQEQLQKESKERYEFIHSNDKKQYKDLSNIDEDLIELFILYNNMELK